MRFRFNINLSDKDYLDFNIFYMIRSPYGKKRMLMLRIMTAVIFGAASLVSLIVKKFTADAWLGIIRYVIMLVLLELLMNKFFVWMLKANIKSFKKTGKMGYSPVSEMEFYDDSFIEITPDNKIDQKYSAVERVSVITDTVIYIHINHLMSYIMPISCFGSKDQYHNFLDLIKTKCTNVDTY